MPDPKESARGRALRVIETLREAGHRALIAGGAVRDLLLGREPDDYDVATSAHPSAVRDLFPKVVPVGEEFGVVLVVLDGRPVQVATFRSDAEYRDGRHPVSVTFTDDPAEDAQRRDFTMNGLFLDPVTDEVVDHVDGRHDIRNRVVRCIGDPRERFREDRLRMLRAVRFAGSLSFAIEEGTRAAISEMAGEASCLSAERVRDELLRILTGPRPGDGLATLRDTGLLAVLLPEVNAMAGVDQPPEFHPEGDVFVHTCLTLDHLEDPDETLALAALLHDVGKPPTFAVRERIRFDRHAEVGAGMAERICRDLRMSRAVTGRVVALVRDHLKFLSVRKMREARLRRFLLSPLAEAHLALHRADCMASHGKLSNWEFCRERRDAWLAEPPRPRRVLTGHDLKKLGLRPGPRFAEILNEVDSLVLEGRIEGREDALRFVRSRYLLEDGNGESDA